jgi:hypothetical protein
VFTPIREGGKKWHVVVVIVAAVGGNPWPSAKAIDFRATARESGSLDRRTFAPSEVGALGGRDERVAGNGSQA